MIAKEIDRLYLYDDSQDGEEAKLLLRLADGEVIKQYMLIPKWAQPIVDALT